MPAPEMPKFDRATRAEKGLVIIRYILDLSARQQQAARFNFPLGAVLGRRQSVLDLDTVAATAEVNATIQAIGGIPAVISEPGITSEFDLLQWLGPNAEDTAIHQWVAQQNGQSAAVTAPIASLEQDLIEMMRTNKA